MPSLPAIFFFQIVTFILIVKLFGVDKFDSTITIQLL